MRGITRIDSRSMSIVDIFNNCRYQQLIISSLFLPSLLLFLSFSSSLIVVILIHAWIITLQENEDRVTFTGQTDRVYLNAPHEIRVVDTTGQSTTLLRTEGFQDCVVWNPWVEKVRYHRLSYHMRNPLVDYKIISTMNHTNQIEMIYNYIYIYLSIYSVKKLQIWESMIGTTLCVLKQPKLPIPLLYNQVMNRSS